MVTSKKTLVSLSAAALIGVTVLGSGVALAQTNSTNPHQNMIQRLAEKLGIDQSKVQSAFDQIHQENQSNRQQKLEDRLSQLVKDGKLTETQKQAIIAKLAEIKNNFNADTFKNMTPQQRKDAMEKQRTDLENWAKSQGIDLSIFPFAKFGAADGMKMRGWHKWGNPTPTPSSTPSI